MAQTVEVVTAAPLLELVPSKMDPAAVRATAVNGMLTLRVLLAIADAETLVKLKAAGFTVTRQSGAMVWGRIAGNRLHELVQLEAVRWVALP